MSELVLVIEDDEAIRDALVELLREEGYSVEGAPHGRAALEILRRPGAARPRLLLVDLMMPVMSGREFRAAQLADAELAAIPVIFISAAAKRPTDLGEVEYLHKPLRLEVVLEAVGRHASR